MAHLFESILKNSISFDEEYSKIKKLFEGETHFEFYSSYCNHLDSEYFRKIDFSSNFTSIDELICLVERETDLQRRFFDYCELIMTVAFQVACDFCNERVYFEKYFEPIIKIIDFDLDKLHMKREIIKNEILGEVCIIVPNDIEAEEAIDYIKDEKSVRDKLIEYRSRKLEGNVEAKANIIKCITPFVDRLTSKTDLKSLNSSLINKLRHLLNNLDLRHDNQVEQGKNKTELYLKTLPCREKWIDNVYTLIISLILLDKQLKINKDFNLISKKSDC